MPVVIQNYPRGTKASLMMMIEVTDIEQTLPRTHYRKMKLKAEDLSYNTDHKELGGNGTIAGNKQGNVGNPRQ